MKSPAFRIAVRAAIREPTISNRIGRLGTAMTSALPMLVVSAAALGSAMLFLPLLLPLLTPFLLLLLLLTIRGSADMAKELRQEILTGSVADGTTSSSAAAEFRNDSSSIIHIRKIHYAHLVSAAGLDENGIVELSKSPTIATLTNNNVFYTYPQRVDSGATSANDTGNAKNGGTTYGKGQLTLEPNESLFVNVSKASGGILTFTYIIEYEFS